MDFKQWLKEAAIRMTPWEAVKNLGLQAKVGQVLTADELGGAYRDIAMRNHPDKNPDPAAAEVFKKAVEAFEVMQRFVGKVVPGEHEQHVPEPEPNYETGRSEVFRRWAERLAPRGRYTMADFEAWVQKVVENQYFQAQSRYEVSYPPWGMDMTKDDTDPFGGVVETERVTGYLKKGSGMQLPPAEKIKKFLSPIMMLLPDAIIDLKFRQARVPGPLGKAWITIQKEDGRYQSFSFVQIKKKEKKPEGVGMKKDEVVRVLRELDLTLVGRYASGDNWGSHLGDGTTGYFIQMGPKVVRFIKRWRTKRYGRSEIDAINVDSRHYGKITKGWLASCAASVKKSSARNETNESFIAEAKERPANKDVDHTLSKVPKKHRDLVAGYSIKFQPSNTLRNDKGHIGFIDEEKKKIVVAAPWNFGREYTLLHEVGHAVWKYLMDKQKKKEWSELLKKEKSKDGEGLDQGDEESFCMIYAQNYAKNKLKKYDRKILLDFISKI
jgi:hypothetical protein